MPAVPVKVRDLHVRAPVPVLTRHPIVLVLLPDRSVGYYWALNVEARTLEGPAAPVGCGPFPFWPERPERGPGNQHHRRIPAEQSIPQRTSDLTILRYCGLFLLFGCGNN